MTCERCEAPLSQQQGRFCSPACYHAARARAIRRCVACHGQFAAQRRRQTFCSLACRRAYRPVRQRLLAILRGNRYTWLTLSDLAIWLQGDDDPADCTAVRTLLYRLRHEDGLTIVSRPAPWDARPVGGPARAYRLVDAATAKETAA